MGDARNIARGNDLGIRVKTAGNRYLIAELEARECAADKAPVQITWANYVSGAVAPLLKVVTRKL